MYIAGYVRFRRNISPCRSPIGRSWSVLLEVSTLLSRINDILYIPITCELNGKVSNSPQKTWPSSKGLLNQP